MRPCVRKQDLALRKKKDKDIRMHSILLLFIFLLPSFGSAATYKIFLDPGHGGKDNGVVYKGIREADIVLQFTQELQEKLAANPDYAITLSRTANESRTLAERVELAEKAKAQLFLSFHVNSTPDAKAQGIEIFFRYPQTSEETKDEVTRIREELHELGRVKNNLHFSRLFSQQIKSNANTFSKTRVLLKQAPFYVISKTEIPSVLIELGFLTHPREREKLLQKSYREEMASEILKAVDLFISSAQNRAPTLEILQTF